MAARMLLNIVAVIVVYSWRRHRSSIVCGGPTTQPMRRPGRPYALLMLPRASTLS